MKALFLSLYADTPHFETELELMCDLLEEGHDVTVLRCTGQLGACPKNPTHKDHICRLCVTKVDAGLATIAHPRLHVDEMRHVAPDPRLPQQFASAQELLVYELDGVELGRGVYSTVCGRVNKDTHLDTGKWAAMIRAELEAAYAMYVATREAIAKHRPDRVYIFNGRFAICHAAVVACEQERVTFFTHERAGTRDKYVVRENTLPHDLAINIAEIEEVWANGTSDKEAIGRRWFLERRNGVERNATSFTKAQTVGLLPAGFDRKKRNIAIFNSTLEEYASIKGWECELYDDEVVGVCRIVDDLAARDDTHVYLRVHPHLKNIPRQDNYQLRIYTELEKRAKNLTIIWPESPVHTYELLDRSTIALTFGSTVGIEACFWGTPSVLAGHAVWEKVGCTHNPRNHDELMKLLTGQPAAKDQLGALKYGYWETVRGTPYRRFRPTGLYTGEWLGRAVKASFSARLQYVVLNKLGR